MLQTIPSLVAPTFLVMIVYLLSVLAMSLRLSLVYRRDPARVGRPRFMAEWARGSLLPRMPSMIDSMGFLFSRRHRDFSDPMLSTLVWTVRLLLPAALSMMVLLVIQSAGSAA